MYKNHTQTEAGIDPKITLNISFEVCPDTPIIFSLPHFPFVLHLLLFCSVDQHFLTIKWYPKAKLHILNTFFKK